MRKKKFEPLYFDEVIARLVVTYNKGKLIPFTGAGISAPNIPTWQKFLENLSTRTGNDFPKKDHRFTTQELIQISEDLVTNLSRESKAHFVKSVKESLGYGLSKPEPTPQCRSLAGIRWPLILSTNYDTMYFDCLEQNFVDPSKVAVFGRNAADCHSLLATLSTSSKSAYWALQGLFEGTPRGKSLEDEIVVGYRQYRNATYSNPTFRSVFSEIFRNNSLFFLGTGLSEDYFRGLFGEVLERFGSNPYMHCALFNEKDKDAIDHHFLHTRFNISSVFYVDEPNKNYSGLYHSLDKLRNAIETENQKFWKMHFSPRNLANLDSKEDATGLEIIAGKMPKLKPNECFVFSAGFDNRLLLSTHGKDYIQSKYSTDDTYDERKFSKCDKGLVSRYDNSNIYAAIARNIQAGVSSRDARDLRVVSEAVEQVLLETNGQYAVINIMLLAAGQGKSFPAVYSFIQMLRGYKKFIVRNKLQSLFRIYVVDPSVLFYARTKPLEIEELLNCDDVRLVIEIRDDGETERSQLFVGTDRTLKGVSDFYSINSEYWNVEFFPVPFKGQSIKPDDATSLEDLGLIPGSMIIYTRKEQP